MIYEGTTSLSRLVVNGEELTLVGNDSVSAKMEVKGVDGAVLLPLVTSNQRIALDNDDFTVQGGMQVFDTDLNTIMSYIDGIGWVEPSRLIRDVSFTFNAAQITGLLLAPITVLPAPGVGFFHSILDISIATTQLLAPFAGGSDLSITYGVQPAQSALEQDIPVGVVTSVVRDFYFGLGFSGSAGPSNEPILPVSLVENQPLILSCTGAFTGGANATVSLTVQYRTISL